MSCLRRKKVISGENDLATVFPQLAAQWDAEKNGSLTPGAVSPNSNRRVWWKCEKGHAYCAVIAHRAQSGSGCPYCTNRKVLAGFNDLDAQRRAHPGNGDSGEPPKGLVAVRSRPCLEGGHLPPYRQAALRLPRLRRQNESKNNVTPARGGGQKIKKT